MTPSNSPPIAPLSPITPVPEHFRAQGLLAFIPSRCAACGHWPSHGLCPTCYSAFKQKSTRCTRCAIEIPQTTSSQLCGHCLIHPFAFDDAIAAVPYTPPWNHLIQRLKFHQSTENTKVIARLMHSAIMAHPHQRPNLIVPIAAARNRMRERGYNQAWEIARHLSGLMGIPSNTHTLVREHEQSSQTHRKRSERFKALKNAFRIAPQSLSLVNNQHIALLDDVMTTGATMQAAAQTLKQAGAIHVSAWVFARTPDPRNQR